MAKFALSHAVGAIVCLGTLAATTPVFAAGTQLRAWVSGLGSDAAGCGSITAPCRSFQYTEDSIVQAGGAIEVKDAANYGAVTITQGLSIINTGGTAGVGISAIGASGITVEAGPTDQVFLKGLTLDGAGNGGYGVIVFSAGNVTIADCTIKGFAQSAVGAFEQQSPASALMISDSVLVGGFYALLVAPGSSQQDPYVSVSLKNVRTQGGQFAALEFDSTADTIAPYVVVSDSTIQGAHTGILGLGTRIIVERTSVLASTSYGVNLQGTGGFLILTGSSVVGSGTADLANGSTGLLETGKNNLFGPTTGTITPYTLN